MSLDTLTSIKVNPKDLKYGKVGTFKKINRIQVYTSKGLMQWDVHRYGEDKPTADIEISFKQTKENDSMNEQKLTTEEEILRDMKLKDGFEKLMKAMLERGKPLTIKIKYHEDKYGELERLNRIEKGDWIDLRAAETVEMKQGEFKLISLGISMQFPPGYEAHMATRSSTYKTWGILLANSHSIIDESYNGDNDIWLFPALAIRDTVIKKGDRIAQFRLVEKMPVIEFEEVKTLGNPDRGGLGSTGKQ